MSHPVGTLHRWSSSHHAPCSGPPLRVTRRRIVAREPRSWRCCAATPPPAPASTRAWPAGCGPGSRMRPTTSSPPGASTRRRSSSGRASCSARTTSSAMAMAAATATAADRLVLVPARAHAAAPTRAHRRDRRPLGRRARRAAGRRRRGRGAADRVAAGGGTHRPRRDAGAPCPQPDRPWSPASPRAGCRGPTTASPSRWPGAGSSCTGCSTSSSGSRSRARRRSARWVCPPAGLGVGAALAALPVVARDPPQRHAPVPAGAARVRVRPLRRRGRARGAPPGDRLAHRRVARPGRPFRRPRCRQRSRHAWIAGSWTRCWRPSPRSTPWPGAPPSRRPSRSWPAWPCGAPGPSGSASPTTRCAPRSPATSPPIPVRRALRLDRAHGAAIHRVGRRAPVAGGHGALPARGGALPAGRILPLGARGQFLGHAARPLGRRPLAGRRGPPSAPRR